MTKRGLTKRQRWRNFYAGSVSLIQAGKYLAGEYQKENQGDELALLLSGIVEDIYKEEG